jgi:tetratricopeptide (TPR) repeat protein
VSGPLFDQYKAALRRGHLATLAGGLDEALEAYREAARLAPERALPYASQGTVLHRLDRWPDAAEAFDRALRLAPDDEATLRARGSAREDRGLGSGAADDYERLAFVLDVAGRSSEAAEAARRAATLQPSPARTALMNRLADAAARAAEPVTGRFAGADAKEAIEGAPDPGAADLSAAEAAAHDTDAPDGAASDTAAPGTAAHGTAAPGGAAPDTAAPDGQAWPQIDLPTPPPPPIVGPPPDLEVLMADAAAALDAGDAARASDLMLTAVSVHRAAGRLDAALDACLQLLAVTPGDPHVHLAIANLQLDHGWTALATEKIDLLLRLTSLTGDTQAEADVHGLAAERLRDEPATSSAAR